MIPQYASNHASAPADEDIFARTQRILEAARAVQVTADARPVMSFPNMMPVPPAQPQPVVMQTQMQTQQQQSPVVAVVAKPQMTAAPMMTAAPAPTTISPTPPQQQQRRVSVENIISPVVQKQAKRRASWLALLNKTDESITRGAAIAPPAAKKARVEVAKPAAPIKKQQPKKLPTNNTNTGKSTSTKKATAAATPKDDKPKRPLSAYNLFFRHERAVILMHEARNPATSKDELLGDAVPVNRLPNQTPAQHRSQVRSVLHDNPFHQDRKTRAHRKSHGKIGFTELVKLVAARWKRADDETKALYDVLSAEEKTKYNVAYEAWRSRQPQDVLDRLDSKKSGGKRSKSPSPTTTTSIEKVNANTSSSKPKKVSPPTKKAILAKAKAAAADLSCFAPMPSLEPISDHDDFALLSDDELSSDDVMMDDLFPMPELAGGVAVSAHHGHGMGVTGGVPTVAGGFDVAPLHGMTGFEAFPLDESLVNFLTEFD